MPEDDDKLPFPVIVVAVFGVVIAAIVTLLVIVAVSN
jgi:cytosine/uracil/thiamine/allantoin permease